MRLVAALTLLLALLDGNSARKCEEKCLEYAKLVYELEESPVLLAEPVYHSVSRCSIAGTPLIVGGHRARHAEFPHMAVIGYGENSTDWLCGGSIISENYVLTAAHCVYALERGPATKVRVGLVNLDQPEDTMQERNVVDRVRHPDFHAPRKYHDIALLRLDVPLDLNWQVRPACLEVNDTIDDEIAIASGFGKTSYETDAGSKDLYKVSLHYVPKENCSRTYSTDFGGRSLPDGLISGMICAGEPQGGKDTCQGDSGGPLQRVLSTPYCMYSVVGVTSFGKFCAFQNTPAVYTRVSAYLDWIESVVWP